MGYLNHENSLPSRIKSLLKKADGYISYKSIFGLLNINYQANDYQVNEILRDLEKHNLVLTANVKIVRGLAEFIITLYRWNGE